MSAPVVRTPRDLPALREWLAEQWKPGHIYAQVAARMFEERKVGTFGSLPHMDGFSYSDWERRAFEHATLWWVGEEMVDLLLAVAPSIPDEVTWHDLAVPSPSGFVVLAKPWIGMDSDTPDHEVVVDGFAWSGSHLPPGIPGREDKPLIACSMSCYQRIDFDDGLRGFELQHAAATGALANARVDGVHTDGGNLVGSLHGEAWLPLGRSDWPIGDRLGDPPWPMEDTRVSSLVEDRRVLAALFVLLATEALAHRVAMPADRPARRRAARAGLTAPDVQIVTLRRPRTEHGVHEGEGHHVDWKNRWIVQPHTRLQPYGPGRSLRKLIIVGPYTKGPADKPLKVPTRVNAWVR